MRRTPRFGYTLLELLIVVGMISLLAITVYSYFSTNVGTNQLKDSTWQVTDALRRAENQAMTGQSNSGWGVHFQSTQFVIFLGSTYNAGDTTNNVVTVLPTSASITGISLNGGGSDVRFAKIKATTSDFGTITLTDSTSAATNTVTISAVGLVDDNT